MARTAPVPNMVAIPGMNPGTIVAGGGGGSGGGSGGSGKGGKDGKGGDGSDGGDDAEGGGKDGKGGEGCGDPVCPITGKMFLEVMDFAFAATKPLTFTRHYTSRRSDVMGSFGFGWTHPFGWQLEERRRSVFVYDDRGDRQKFARPVDGGPASSHPFGWTLARVGDTYRLTRDGGEVLIFERHGAARRFLLRFLSDVRGNTTTVEYDDKGRFIGLTDSEGRPFRASLDELGRIVRFQVPTEATQQNWMDLGHYRYDEFGDLVEYIDAVGFSWQYRYHNHLMVEHRTGCGLSYLYRYDGDTKDAYCIESWGEYVGRDDPALLVPISEVLKNTDPFAPKPKGINYVKLTYVKEQYYSEVENGLGGVTRYFGDSYGRVVKEVAPNGAAYERTFDENSGEITESRDPAGVSSLPIVDDEGNPRGYVRADGSSVIVNAPAPFEREVEYHPEGDKFFVRYDAFGAPVYYKHPDGTFEAIEYDSRGRRVSRVSRSGGTTRYTYDAMSNIVRMDLPSGEYHELAYDYLGRHIYHRHPTGRETHYGWDGRSELIFRRISGGPDEHFQYEANRKCTWAKIGSRVWTREYGGLGWLIRGTEFDGSTIDYRYDVEGRVVWVRNARGQEYRVERDLRGSIIGVEDFEGMSEERRLDALGEVIALKNPAGISAREYDIEGRLIAVETPDDAFTLTYGRRGVEEITSTSVLLRSQYDAVGQVIAEQQGRHQTQISWKGGQLERVSSDVGVPLEHTFQHGFLRKLRAGTNEIHIVSPSPTTTIYYLSPTLLRKEERDIAGVVQKVTYGTYLGHLGIRDGDLAQLGGSSDFLTVTYSHSEFREIIAESWSSGRSVAYELDAGGRVKNKTVSLSGNVVADETVRYDAVSTPIFSGVAYDGHVRPTNYLGESLEYDARGNLVRRISDAGTWSYEWDFVGNLRRVQAPKHSVEMDYDGRGRRMAKRVFDDAGTLAKEVTFVWSNQTLLREVNHTSGWCRTYLRDPERWAPFGHVDSKGDEQKSYFYLSDPSGMPDLALDEQGRTVWSAERTVFGEIRVSPASEIDLHVRFAGQLYDPDVELTYNRNRWYDARVGLYVSPDPISLDGGVALRNYVSNPTHDIDPLGHAANGNYKVPDSLKGKVTQEQLERSVPGEHANLDPNADVPGFVPCSKAELNAGGDEFSSDTRKKIDAAGAEHGCHTCNSKHPMGKEAEDELKKKCKDEDLDFDEELKKEQGATHFVPDHVPPAGMHTKRGKRGITLDPDDIEEGSVILLPHCRKCSNKQGGTQSGLLGSLTATETEELGQSIMDTNLEQTKPKPKKKKQKTK